MLHKDYYLNGSVEKKNSGRGHKVLDAKTNYVHISARMLAILTEDFLSFPVFFKTIEGIEPPAGTTVPFEILSS
jgi:hypothetical protein